MSRFNLLPPDDVLRVLDKPEGSLWSFDNAIAHSPRNLNQEISIHSWKSLKVDNAKREELVGLIKPPKVTEEVREYLIDMGLI